MVKRVMLGLILAFLIPLTVHSQIYCVGSDKLVGFDTPSSFYSVLEAYERNGLQGVYEMTYAQARSGHTKQLFNKRIRLVAIHEQFALVEYEGSLYYCLSSEVRCDR